MWSRRVLIAVLLVLFLAGTAPVAWGWAGGGYSGGGGGGGFGGGGGGFSGGSGFHGGGSHYSSSGSSGGAAIVPLLIVIAAIVLIIIGSFLTRLPGRFDLTYRLSDIMKKSEKTTRLLEFISKTDPAFAPEALRQMVMDMFFALQRQWEVRDYTPLKNRMMPDLYLQHCKQIEGMIRLHEINVIDQLSVERVDIVHVRYTQNVEHREFTALISARGADGYFDDRNRSWLRGSRVPTRYQEFWTFQRQGGKFLLREIAQAAESSVLREDDFFEPFTDATTAQIVGPSEAGPAGPAISRSVLAKSEKIERLLNFLGQSDKLWNRQLMLKRARETFLQVHLAQEAGDPAVVPTGLLFPDVADWLTRQIKTRRNDGATIEFRSLCVRKADLVFVKNAPGREKDEFVVYFTAHTQRILRRGNKVLQQDPYVGVFDAYWTFGRHEGQWKLKEILPPAQGAAALAQENVDLEASPEQLQWFYRQKRAV